MAAARRIAVVGAGIGGLSAALDLAARGCEVVVLERAAEVGGKLREVTVGDCRLDAGPTVLTMRWVFDALFADAGQDFAAAVALEPAAILARHAWADGGRLDLHADPAASAEAIARFAGADEGQRFLAFAARARAIYTTLEGPFLQRDCGSPLALARAVGLSRLDALWRISPFTSLWRALGQHFRDPRLRQLFGRYATYCGSSPFAAPATLMLVAHVEQAGVWRVRGGMHRLAEALAAAATRAGATIRCSAQVAEILDDGGRVSGVRLADGERVAADAVIFNGDPAALAAGSLGPCARNATPARPPRERSLSALVWNLVTTADGFPLSHHNVFFSADSRAEFRDLFDSRRLPQAPTVYVCAQDRGDEAGAQPAAGERLLCLVNAPANGDADADADAIDPRSLATCETATFALLARCGLTLRRSPEATVLTTPADFHRLFPATGGALYGPASHGWRASFRRPGARSRLPGLYLAGGATHPGPGLPMAALSGRLAAASLLADLGSTRMSRPAAIGGGISTPSATTAGTA